MIANTNKKFKARQYLLKEHPKTQKTYEQHGLKEQKYPIMC